MTTRSYSTRTSPHFRSGQKGGVCPSIPASVIYCRSAVATPHPTSTNYVVRSYRRCQMPNIWASSSVVICPGTSMSDVAKRANYTLGLIRRNLRHCPRDAKTTAYFSVVRSTTDYCSAIWDPYLEKDKTKLERVNRRAARVVCNKTDPRDHTSITNLLRDSLGWPTLEHRRRHLRLTLMYKICHQQIAVPPTQLLPPNCPTRSNHQYKYQTIQTHTEVYRNSFYPRTIPDWNRLPAEAVNCPSADSFRQQLAKPSP